jgi:signal transduction histidine kinase
MTQATLRFAPDILKRLGEELNPNLDQGILELVKNAYDADAVNCTIALADTNTANGTVRVTDDGDGMELDDIINGWLVLGRSAKSASKISRKGRFLAGNKGLGRLAALRMGAVVSLITRPFSQPDCEYHLEIDWERFNQAHVVEEVGLDIRTSRTASPAASGTDITISHIRSQLSRAEVKRLARGILLLADPFVDDPVGFQPVLIAPEFRDLEQLVKHRYFEDAEFHLNAMVDADGTASAKVTDWKGNVLYVGDHSDISPRSPDRLYHCPPSTFDLWVFILDKRSFLMRPTTVGEVREWLREFGGVHLYMRGLRVAPYGNPGYDWLEMNLKRARSPELRPSTNTSIGRIATDDPEGKLLQKTDRSGLVEDESFFELKRFAIDAMDWLARRRLEERESRQNIQRTEAPKKVEEARKTFTEVISDLPSSAQQNVRQKFEQYDRARNAESQLLRKEVQLYRTLSTAGITATVFAHESMQPISLIMRNARQIEKQVQQISGMVYENGLQNTVYRIMRQAEMLQAFSNLSLSFVDYEKRRAAKVEIHTVILDLVKVFDLFVKDRQVQLVTQLCNGNPYIRGSQAALESILTNLLVNSLKAFEQAKTTGDRKIFIQTAIHVERVILRVVDNGPGIQGISVDDIWLPGETTYPNGTGLGLSIVRDTVRDLGGIVHAVAHGEPGGAEIIVELPVVGV